MSDGANLGITAGRALETVLGGKEQPTEEEHNTPEQVRARIEATHLFIGQKPFEQEDGYSVATDMIAHAFLVLIEEDPSLLEPRYYPDDYELDSLRGVQKSADSALWEAMKKRWPHADEFVGGATGFMVGFALNTALYASGSKLHFRNSAIMTVK